jgi:hypothetical protein
MPILATLKKDGLGAWKSLDELLSALRARENTAVAALGQALGAEPAEQKELAAAEPELLVELASDLRLQKGSRLSALRCLLELGAFEQRLAELFLAAGDLLTDPRLGSRARQLAEQGLAAALKLSAAARQVSFEAGDLARAGQAASSVLGAQRVRELLGAAPAGHAGAEATRFALGDPLPDEARARWEKLLTERCSANRKAPAAARRLGLAPPWPPFLPEAFAPLVQAAEAATQHVATTDALARAAPGPAAAAAAAAPAPPKPAPAPARPPPPPRNYSRQELGTRALAPPIKQVPRSTGFLVEGPPPEAQARRNMPAITPRMPVGPAAVAPSPGKASPLAGATLDPLSNLESVAQHPLATRLPAEKLAALALEKGLRLPDGSTYQGTEPLRFDPLGKRIPRSDRWEGDAFEWEEPVLPPSRLKVAGTAPPVQGPFAARLRSLLDDRPEAVDRLCAAAEARAALAGEAALLAELTREVLLPRWRERPCPEAQLRRLRLVAEGSDRPSASRSAAQALLTALTPRPG